VALNTSSTNSSRPRPGSLGFAMHLGRVARQELAPSSEGTVIIADA
jgi:hypothetical protein